MDYIFLEIDSGIKYKIENSIMKLIYTTPLEHLLLRPNVVRVPPDYSPSRDPYEEKVTRVKAEVFELLRGEPFQGVTERGSTAGRGLSDLPRRMELHFLGNPSSDLVNKIKNIKGVRNVEYRHFELEPVENYA